MTNMSKTLIIPLIFLIATQGLAQEGVPTSYEWRLPLKTTSRKDLSAIRWDPNGQFMARRYKHLHTGIDLMNQGAGEAVYAASCGKVVSLYATEPNKAVMIQHHLPSGQIVWTVYVHVTRIKVQVGDVVTSKTVIAHLMNENQLDKYGWTFNHLHFEILKRPRKNKAGKYLSYSTKCKTKEEVRMHFLDPIGFLEKAWALERISKKH